MMKLAALAATIAAASAMVAPPKIEMDDMIETALKRGGTEDVFFHLSKTSTDAAKAHKASLILISHACHAHRSTIVSLPLLLRSSPRKTVT